MTRKVYLMILLFVLSMFLVPNAHAVRGHTPEDTANCFKDAVPVTGYGVGGGTTAIEWVINDPDCDEDNCGLNKRNVVINSIKLRRYEKAAQPSFNDDPGATRMPDPNFGYTDANNVWQTYWLITSIVQPAPCNMSVLTNELAVPNSINNQEIVAFNNPFNKPASAFIFTLEYALSATHSGCKCENHEGESHSYQGSVEIQYEHMSYNPLPYRTVTCSFSNNAIVHGNNCTWSLTSTIVHTNFCNPLIVHNVDGGPTNILIISKTYTYARVDPVWPIAAPAGNDPLLIDHGVSVIDAVPGKTANCTVTDVLGTLSAGGTYAVPSHTHSPTSEWEGEPVPGCWDNKLNCTP